MPEKPDSKRGRVRTQFREHGEAAALAFGEKLGIKPARLKRWFKQWNDPDAGNKVKAKRPRVAGNNARVFLFGDTNRTGYLLEQGDEQSVVLFDNGNERIVANSWFQHLPPEQDRKRRAV